MADRFRSRNVSFRGRTSQRRKTLWTGSAADATVNSLAASAAVLDQSLTFVAPETIVRVRGTLWVRSDQLAASESAYGALGMSVVKDPALAIGVTAVPTPITDISDDSFFLWMPYMAAIVVEGSTAGFTWEHNPFDRYEFDSKAMRKVSDGDSMIVTLENESAFGIFYVINFRLLTKLA